MSSVLALKNMRLLFSLLICHLLISINSAEALCVIAQKANLRAEPSSNGKKLWTVGKYMPFIEVDERGGWYLVKDLEGKKMWIAKGLVTDEIDCAVIRVKKSVLRKGPGKEFGKTPLTYAGKYMPFKKLQRDEAWLYLEDDFGFKHWVYERNVWEPLAYTRLNY